MTWRYRHPRGVQALVIDRPLLTTANGGVVVVDEPLARLWHAADGRTVDELSQQFARDSILGPIVSEALACLAEAGFLVRDLGLHPTLAADFPLTGPTVAAIVVVTSEREVEWLDGCLDSIAAQRYEAMRIVVVDNGAGPALAECCRRKPKVSVWRRSSRANLARALNDAAAQVWDDFFFFLNPDTRLLPGAVSALVSQAEASPDCAAVAPKVRLWRTPAFLNGIGNRARVDEWATDVGIGHLDLGQFDAWREVLSGSLTALFVRRRAWDMIGPFDERFPAYYEDAEWCYRARLAGHPIAAAPRAEVLHVFGGFWDVASDGDLPARKLRTVVIGRARFDALLPKPRLAQRLVRGCLLQDVRNAKLAVTRRDFTTGRAYAQGWASIVWTSPLTWWRRQILQRRRRIDDDALFDFKNAFPLPRMWRNVPVLTIDLIADDYASLIRTGRTRSLPESTFGLTCTTSPSLGT